VTELDTEPVAEPLAVPVPDLAPRPHRARTAPEQAPNLGRIVLYHQIESPQNPAIVTPAIIQAVREDGSVRLFVFGHPGAELVDDVAEGDAVGEWSWPTPVNTPGGGAGAPPVLTALQPATAVLGSPSFTLHVIGSGFGPDAVISFAGHDEPTTVVSPTEVTTGVDMSVWLGPDTLPVTVRNGDGTASAPLTFTFTAATMQSASRRRAAE
jgi:hypothetical protein